MKKRGRVRRKRERCEKGETDRKCTVGEHGRREEERREVSDGVAVDRATWGGMGSVVDTVYLKAIITLISPLILLASSRALNPRHQRHIVRACGEGRDGGRGGREGGREGNEGGREGGREGRKGGREGGREGGS